MDQEDDEFEEEFLSQEDPSILHFLLASGDQVLSQVSLPLYLPMHVTSQVQPHQCRYMRFRRLAVRCAC